MAHRIALATCKVLPEPDPDEEITVRALVSAGFEVELVAWDDEGAKWSEFDACIIRSTWNYFEQPERFLKWAKETSTQTILLNPFEILDWNHHKGYLLELEQQGVPVVPTILIPRGKRGGLSSLIDNAGWPEVVVKPAISAGSYKTERFGPEDLEAAADFLEQITLHSDAMIQPFIASVSQGGEVSWTWIDGQITHGVQKFPRFSVDSESVSSALFPSTDELSQLQVFVEAIPKSCLYARIDVMEHDGKWLLSELELIEPSLFFMQNPKALAQFVSGTLARIR